MKLVKALPLLLLTFSTSAVLAQDAPAPRSNVYWYSIKVAAGATAEEYVGSMLISPDGLATRMGEDGALKLENRVEKYFDAAKQITAWRAVGEQKTVYISTQYVVSYTPLPGDPTAPAK